MYVLDEVLEGYEVWECLENLQFGRVGEKGVGTNLWLCNFLQFHCSVRMCCTVYCTKIRSYVHTEDIHVKAWGVGT